MSDELRGPGLRLVGDTSRGGPTDSRVAMVLEVLAGEREGDVARRWAVDPALVNRWVRAFVAAGEAEVTNQPRADAARQRDRFLTAFAHELRTPLSVAQGWAAVLDDEELAPPLGGIVTKLADALDRWASARSRSSSSPPPRWVGLRLAPEHVTLAATWSRTWPTSAP